ncbi:free fatty acid receptor 4-like [Erpetoichthys calabaricus]|uniref:free fatty acid receptor 4-like n=1 Tax=Erpetoichthys calabaricus TaxID=27687 RepID=UPI002234D13B|nr:free fatty acid receptor 4-like [Erpetoichthys calabaricus]
MKPHSSPFLNFGNFSYFYFFSDFKTTQRILVTSLETLTLSFVLLLALVGNLGAIALLVRGRLLVNKHCFVLNLFVADLLFVSAIPLIISVRWTESWILGVPACHLLFYVMSISACVTITTLATISLERMHAILHLELVPVFNGKFVLSALAFIWLSSAFTSLPFCLFFHVITVTVHGKEQKVQICTMMWPNVPGEIFWEITFTSLDFVIPGLIIIISYVKILQIKRSSRERLQCRTENHILVSRQDLKLFRTLLLLMVSFFLTWSPIFITMFLILLRNFQSGLLVSSSLFFWVVVFTFSSTILNPVLYGVSHFRAKQFRSFCCFTVVPRCKISNMVNIQEIPQLPQERIT